MQRSIEQKASSFERWPKRRINEVTKCAANPGRYALVLHAIQMHRVAIVSGKQFIAAIASKRYRHVLAGNAADVVGRDRGGVAKRLFHHAGQVVECFSDVWFNYEFVMLR